jgi:hypothetical protein
MHCARAYAYLMTRHFPFALLYIGWKYRCPLNSNKSNLSSTGCDSASSACHTSTPPTSGAARARAFSISCRKHAFECARTDTVLHRQRHTGTGTQAQARRQTQADTGTHTCTGRPRYHACLRVWYLGTAHYVRHTDTRDRHKQRFLVLFLI